jgi:hypothetical protein
MGDAPAAVVGGWLPRDDDSNRQPPIRVIRITAAIMALQDPRDPRVMGIERISALDPLVKTGYAPAD